MSNNSTDGKRALKNTARLTTETVTDDNIIIHVDCDCFYAACERIKEPKLQGEPVIVGMGYDAGEKHGAVATASYEARTHGVHSAMPIEDALEQLPRRDHTNPNTETTTNGKTAYYRPVDMEFYEAKGEEIHTILTDIADTFEPVSIDEAYLDVTSKTNWESLTEFTTQLQTQITETTNIPVSIGAAPTKSAAKIASDYNKPNGVKIVTPGSVQEFFADLPVSDIHGIGEVTTEKLHDMEITTGGELAAADPGMLTDVFGTRGEEIHQRARGHDPRDVSPPDDPKSISNETSLGKTGADSTVAANQITELCEQVGERVTNKNAFFKTISIKIVLPPFDVKTRAYSLPGGTQSTRIIHDVTNDLFEEFTGEQIRKIGVRVSNLSFSNTTQTALDEWGEYGDCTQPGEIATNNHAQHAHNTDTQTKIENYKQPS